MDQHACTAAASGWLSEVGDQPFFLFFHTLAAHEPYLARRYVGKRDGGRFSDVYIGESRATDVERVCCRDADLSQQEREFMLALYDGGVATADELVGDLLDALEQRGLKKNAVIIITSDHGQEFWQHTGRGGHSLYDELLHVPLLWYDPRNPGGGESVGATVSLIDIVPTLEKRFDLPADATLDGIDLQPLLVGDFAQRDRVRCATREST